MEKELPYNWKEDNLEHCLIDLINGTTIKQNKDKVGLPVTRIETIQKSNFDLNRINYIENISDGLKQRFKYQIGDIAFSHINSMEHVGKVALYEGQPKDLIHGMNLLRLRFDQTKLVPRFAYYFMLTDSFRESVRREVGQAVNQVSINQKNLNKISISYPLISEQKQIVNKLDALMEKVNANKARLDKIPQILKRFRQSVLAAAVSGRLTEEWRGKDSFEPKENLPFEIPVCWKEESLRNLVTKFTYGSSQKSELSGKVPVLRMGNIQEGKIEWDDLKYSNDRAEIKKYNLENGDVLFNRTNSPDLVGKTAIYRGEQQAIYAGYLIKMKASEKLNPEYLNFCLNTTYAKEWCSQVKTDGVSQSNINAQKLADFIIPITNVKEQQEIVKRVNELFAFADKVEARYNKAKVQLDKLPQSILAKAFRGELNLKEPINTN